MWISPSETCKLTEIPLSFRQTSDRSPAEGRRRVSLHRPIPTSPLHRQRRRQERRLRRRQIPQIFISLVFAAPTHTSLSWPLRRPSRVSSFIFFFRFFPAVPCRHIDVAWLRPSMSILDDYRRMTNISLIEVVKAKMWDAPDKSSRR